MDQLVLIAKVLSPNGLKGFVVLESFSDNLLFYIEKYKLVDANNDKYKLNFIRTAKNNRYIVKIEGINSREDAEKLNQKELFMPRSKFKNDLAEDEFYVVDLIGLEVIDVNSKEKIGLVKNIVNFGAGDIVVIEDLEKKEEMYLLSEHYFPEINIALGKVYFNSSA